ncbi:hypothetical protein J2S62_000019 [Enteractinococcus fodinae]|uniref:Uncharacterized protein n=1 Tax=Enteractinococcus fodinae TaxID=684663 RepID=A0ABU2AWP4_9MICC|nr:hypothetical protein [Enteractinococcus fodinae]
MKQCGNVWLDLGRARDISVGPNTFPGSAINLSVASISQPLPYCPSAVESRVIALSRMCIAKDLL